MLRALGFTEIQRFHMNEGHASLLSLELLYEASREGLALEEAVEQVRRRCVFTTHTPVPAGHDQFEQKLVEQVLGGGELFDPFRSLLCPDGVMNMTHVALTLSGYINGVAKKHGEISRFMFPDFPIDSITNGVHVETWATDAFKELFDRFIPGWHKDNFSLRQALKIPAEQVAQAHRQSKQALLDQVHKLTGQPMKVDVLTVGFARRAATYKRADLLFHDIERLKEISDDFGPLQLIYAGKAHPRDEGGKDIIQRIIKAGSSLKNGIRLVYLPDYDMELGKLVCGGVDVWLNNPQPPLEASGTSGMKAALNGVPSLSVLDGWWIEGHIEGVTGWSIESSNEEDEEKGRAYDAAMLYGKLKQVMKLFYRHLDQFVDVMRQSIALNGSFFNTQRMVQQYVLRAYLTRQQSAVLLPGPDLQK